MLIDFNKLIEKYVKTMVRGLQKDQFAYSIGDAENGWDIYHTIYHGVKWSIAIAIHNGVAVVGALELGHLKSEEMTPLLKPEALA